MFEEKQLKSPYNKYEIQQMVDKYQNKYVLFTSTHLKFASLANSKHILTNTNTNTNTNIDPPEVRLPGEFETHLDGTKELGAHLIAMLQACH